MAQFSDLYGKLLDRELGTDDTTELFTTQRRKDATNEAQLEWARQTRAFRRESTIALVDNTREYDLEASFTDLLFAEPMRVELQHVSGGKTTYTAGDDLLRRDVPWLNRNRPGWRGSSKGAPDVWYLREDGGKVFLGFDPPPEVKAGDTRTAVVEYVADPPAMQADAAEPFAESQSGTGSTQVKITLRPWHAALAKWAAYLLEQLRKNYQVAELRRAEFIAEVNRYLEASRPAGGGHVQYARNYRRELGRVGDRPPDPRR